MSQPNWMTDEVFDKIWELKELEFRLYLYTPQMTAMKSGIPSICLCLCEDI